MIEFKVEMHR